MGYDWGDRLHHREVSAMKPFKFLGFMLLGAVVMFAMLLWMSQFFTNDEERESLIWLNTGGQQSDTSRPPWLAR